MKNKEIWASVIGGSFFAATYLAFGVPLIPAIAIGGLAFAGGDLLMSKSEVIFDKIDNKNIDKVIEDANNKSNYITKMIPKIDDKTIQNNLIEITDTTNKIIKTVRKDKKKIKTCEKFFTYYLPITVGIVTKYDDIENQKLSSKEAKNFYEKAKESLNQINTSFKKILDNLYDNDIVNVETDMKVLNNILKSDGFNEIAIDNKEEKDE